MNPTTTRRVVGVLALALLVVTLFGVVGLARPPGGHPSCDHANDPHGIHCPRDTTSTTSPPRPTTTDPDTTTTTPGETSTTEAGGPLVIPATLPYPGGLNEGEGYNLIIGCINTLEVTCQANEAGGLSIAEFPYLGHGMPYLYSEAVEGNHDHAWWVNGDREGYRCAYGFMYDKHPNPHPDINRPAEFIARFTFVRPLGTSYGRVNDAYMEEGQRYYDGTPASEGQEIGSEDCQSEALDDFDYDSYVPHGPDDIRVGLFREDGEIGDIRDFTTVDVGVPGHFEFVGIAGNRVTIVFILGATNKVSHVIYYDALNTGRIAVEVNG